MWEISKKIEFSEYNQTPENIFPKKKFRMQLNTWKYFSFPKISSPKNILYLNNILHVAKHSFSGNFIEIRVYIYLSTSFTLFF